MSHNEVPNAERKNDTDICAAAVDVVRRKALENASVPSSSPGSASDNHTPVMISIHAIQKFMNIPKHPRTTPASVGIDTASLPTCTLSNTTPNMMGIVTDILEDNAGDKRL